MTQTKEIQNQIQMLTNLKGKGDSMLVHCDCNVHINWKQ